jgi:hypothetical protein
MNWQRFTCVGFSALFALALCLGLIHIIGWDAARSVAAAPPPSAPGTVHLHGQIRDTGGNPRQGFVVISSYLGPDITQTVSTAEGFYEFNVPALDHYVVTVFPYQRAAVGRGEVPIGFLDRWERINRTTESDLRVDLIVKPGGTILLDAYNPQGGRMFGDNFPHLAMFVVYPLGNPPVTDPLQGKNHQLPLLWGWETVSGTLKNPAVLMLPSQVTTTFTVWGLWTVPEAGTIMLEMDNGGLGYGVAEGEVKTVNIAYEFARTEYRKAQQKYTQKISVGYVFSPTVALWLTQAQAALNTAQAQLQSGNGQGAAVSAYQALTPTIRAKEAIALEVARQDIERNRRRPVTIRVVGADLRPLGNVQVAYQQSNHDFILSGNWGGSAALAGDTPATRRTVGNANVYADIAKEIGFEYVNYPPNPTWGVVQREWPSVPYRFDDDVILHKLADRGFRSIGQPFWFAGSPVYYPAYLEGLHYTQVKTAALDYLTTTMSHYAGKIQVWNVVNEPNSANSLDFTPAEMLDFTKAMLAAGKAADPQGVMLVNLSAPGLGFFGGGPGDESTKNYSTYNYLHAMLNAGVRPDVIGVQFYNGAYLPAIDLGTASDLLDLYGSDFDLPFYIEELEYPTHEEYPGLENISNFWGWHQGHTDQAQADWAVGIYTLAFSKPHIIGANWSMSYDLPIDQGENGRAGDGYLHRDGLTPRPIAYALRDLFHSWTISGTAQTGAAGQIGFDGFTGEYLLTLTGPNGAVHQETIHVREGQTNTFTINFDPQQTLTDNQQSAAVSLDKARSAFAWADSLGKTGGVAEARGLDAQARTAYATGQYWNAALLGQQACDALAFKIDGEAGDWSGVNPLFTQSEARGEANNSELRRFYGTMDDSALVLQFAFNTSTPRREFLFELDAGADGVRDYAVTASPWASNILFFSDAYAGDPARIFTHLIPSIDVIYSSTVEIRIPLAELGNPDRVEVVLYREDLGDGNMSGVIPSLGVMAALPERIDLQPLVVTPGHVNLQVGGTQPFTAKGFDVNNHEVSIEPIWTTSGGMITSGGLFTATTAGDFTVTASVRGSSVIGTATVHVTPGNLVRIDVTPAGVSLQVGGTQQFNANGYSADNHEAPIEPIWTTSGGTITSGGLFTATTAGDFTVTASVQGSSVTGTANVEVSQTAIAPWLWLIGGLLALAVMGGAGYLTYRIKTTRNRDTVNPN